MLSDRFLLSVSSLFSWPWSTACCHRTPTSVPRRLISQGCPSSRSSSCLADWPWGSAPALTAPLRWAAPHARHQLTENLTTCDPHPHLVVCHPTETPRCPAIPSHSDTITLNTKNSRCAGWRRALFTVVRHTSCTATFLSKYTCRYILLPRLPILILLTNEGIF